MSNGAARQALVRLAVQVTGSRRVTEWVWRAGLVSEVFATNSSGPELDLQTLNGKARCGGIVPVTPVQGGRGSQDPEAPWSPSLV